MPETDIRTLVSIESDDKGVDAARRALKQIQKDQEELVSAFRRGEKDVESYSKELKSLQQQEKKLQGSIDSITGEFTDQAKAMKAAAAEAAKLARQQEELGSAQGRFDVTSRNVALAGDVESQLRTLTGGIGAIGGGVGQQLEQSINIGAEGFASLEALPKLKEAFKGLPDVVNSAASALGTSGAGLIGSIGAVAIAVVALQAVFAAFQAEQEKQAEATRSRIDAISRVNQELASGIGTEEIQARIQELQQSNEGYSATLQRLQGVYDSSINSLDGATRAVVQLGSGAEEELAGGIDSARNSIAANNQAIQDYQAALESGQAAANDMIAAERALAEERTQAALAAGQEAASLEQARQQTIGATQEQLDNLTQSEQNRIGVLQAELNALKATGDTSDQVTGRIEQLERQLDTANQRLNTFRNAVGAAPEQMNNLSSSIQQAGSSASSAASQFSQAASQIQQTSSTLSNVRRPGGPIATGIMISPAARAQINAGRARLGLPPLREPQSQQQGQQAVQSFTSNMQSATDKARDLANQWREITNNLNQGIFEAKKAAKDALDDLNIDIKRRASEAYAEGNFLVIAQLEKERQQDVQDITRERDRRIRDLQQEATQQQQLSGATSGGGGSGTVQVLSTSSRPGHFLSPQEIEQMAAQNRQAVRTGVQQVMSATFRSLN